MIKSPIRSRSRRRIFKSGSQTIEMIVALPILFFAFVAVVQYGIQMLIQQAATQAVSVGAREAGKGADLNQVVASVNAMLAPHNLIVSNAAGSKTKVILETSNGAAVTTTSTFGDAGLVGSPPAFVLSANEARVTLCIGLTKSPMLNAFPSVGFDTTAKSFEISSLVKKE